MTKRRRAVAIVTILLAGGALLAQKPDPASEPRRRVLVLDENAMPVPNAALAFRSLDDGVAVEDLSVDLELAFAALPRVLTDANGVASLPTGLRRSPRSRELANDSVPRCSDSTMPWSGTRSSGSRPIGPCR